MTGADFIALLPLLIVAGTAVLAMALVAIRRSHAATVVVTLAGLAAALASLWPAASVSPRHVTPLLIVDAYALFYTGLILAASIGVVLLSYGYFRKYSLHREELYILLLVATLGSAVLVAAGHFASFFLGLELLSVALYGMISYPHLRPLPLEAGLKYLVLAAVSTAFLLFGMALIYAAAGTMEFGRMAAIFRNGSAAAPGLILPGLALMITGFGFKLAVVPFHLWTPDVYEGAPAPVTAYIATVSKGAMFALLLRYFNGSAAHANGPVFTVFSIIAIASMLAGNIMGLLQNNVKRILAYSSIAHLGYLLVAFQAAGNLGAAAVTFYLVAYFVTTLGAFGIVTILSDGDRDADSLEDYRGLFWRRPAVAAVFTIMLLSLAGIPVTAGFFGKFYIVAAGAAAASWALVVILVVASSIGLFYYLRIVVAMYGTSREGSVAAPSLPAAGAVALTILSGLLLWFGTFPNVLLNAIHEALAGLA
jgi:NADH-quinone oxidoreductase subunit N